MSIKSKLFTTILLFSSFQQAYAQGTNVNGVILNGVNLNPLLFCVLTGGLACIEQTGIKPLDMFFDKENGDMSHYETYEWRQYYYNSQEYWGFDHSPGPGECRRAKEDFYLKKIGFKNSPHGPGRDEYLRGYKQMTRNDIFECTASQRKIFIETKVGVR